MAHAHGVCVVAMAALAVSLVAGAPLASDNQETQSEGNGDAGVKFVAKRAEEMIVYGNRQNEPRTAAKKSDPAFIASLANAPSPPTGQLDEGASMTVTGNLPIPADIDSRAKEVKGPSDEERMKEALRSAAEEAEKEAEKESGTDDEAHGDAESVENIEEEQTPSENEKNEDRSDDGDNSSASSQGEESKSDVRGDEDGNTGADGNEAGTSKEDTENEISEGDGQKTDDVNTSNLSGQESSDTTASRIQTNDLSALPEESQMMPNQMPNDVSGVIADANVQEILHQLGDGQERGNAIGNYPVTSLDDRDGPNSDYRAYYNRLLTNSYGQGPPIPWSYSPVYRRRRRRSSLSKHILAPFRATSGRRTKRDLARLYMDPYSDDGLDDDLDEYDTGRRDSSSELARYLYLKMLLQQLADSEEQEESLRDQLEPEDEFNSRSLYDLLDTYEPEDVLQEKLNDLYRFSPREDESGSRRQQYRKRGGYDYPEWRRKRFFYPAYEEPQTHWGAFVPEKRSYDDSIRRLQRLALALGDDDRS